MLVLFHQVLLSLSVFFFSKTGHSHFCFFVSGTDLCLLLQCLGAAWIDQFAFMTAPPHCGNCRMTRANERLIAVIRVNTVLPLSAYLSVWLPLSFDDLICLILHFNFASCSFNQSRCLSGEEHSKERIHRTLSTISFSCTLLAIAAHTYECLRVNK